MIRWAADHPLQLVLGLGAWAAWFVFVYGGMSLACALVPPPPEQGPLNAVNGILFLSGAGLTALLLAGAYRGFRKARRATHRTRDSALRTRFAAASGAALYLWAAAATAVVALPLLVLPACL